MEPWFLMNGGIVRPPGGKQQTNNLCNFRATINILRIRELWELSQAGESFIPRWLVCSHCWEIAASKGFHKSLFRCDAA